MPADEAPEQSAAMPSRSERLTHDVLHALMIDPKPWAEIQAHRRDVVRTTFAELEPQDEFEGMLASQMAIAHSVFLGTTWLSLDRERPERDRTHYLRQAARLMMLYRQSFNTLRQWRRERTRAAPYGPRRRLAFARPVAEPRPAQKNEPEPSNLPRTGACFHCAVRESTPATTAFTTAKLPPLDFSVPHNHRRQSMETTGLAFALGP